MSPEFVQIVLVLTFLGICGLVGEILVQGRRDRAAEARLRTPSAPKNGPHSMRKVRGSAVRS
jgi:hypothetical protein